MTQFLIIIEKAEKNYSAYAPDVPGCIATGKTLEDVKMNMKEAIEMHLEGMLEDGELLPVPESMTEYVDVVVPDSAT